MQLKLHAHNKTLLSACYRDINIEYPNIPSMSASVATALGMMKCHRDLVKHACKHLPNNGCSVNLQKN